MQRGQCLASTAEWEVILNPASGVHEFARSTETLAELSAALKVPPVPCKAMAAAAWNGR